MSSWWNEEKRIESISVGKFSEKRTERVNAKFVI